ncbi:type II secretion system F family protein [Syntrophomonas palmitatica]|uniref:type II secretion system F family protein n=1 Tax=Syntrophomonas palmitatica TaxID=402877 RepID=UPI0006CF7280|nr:type II secretion system F family protein [Syntrophomonas palmitatica]
MSELGLIIGCFLIFIALVVITQGLSNKSSGVALHDEWKETKINTLKSARKKNLIIGFVVSIAIAYIVTGNIAITIIAGIVGANIVAGRLTASKIKKTREMLEEQYTQVLNTIVSSLQGGANPYQALEETVTGLQNPARDIFIEIIRRNRTGINYSDALRMAAEETGWNDLKQLEMAFRLYDRTGSNLVQVCNHLLQSAYDRRHDRKYVAATTASIRTTTGVLSVIPFVIMAFMRFVAPDFAEPLFNTTGGLIVFTIIIGLIYAGNKVAQKMVVQLIGE